MNPSARSERSSILIGIAAAGVLLTPATKAHAVSGSIRDVEHVVMLMMENRSFDQIFGTLPGVRGFADANAIQLPNGNSVFYQPQWTNYVLPFHPTNQCIDDVNHDWYFGHIAWDQGQWDRWIPARSPRAMTYCTRDDLGFLYALADAYTLCDAYFCSVIGPTYPNRLYHFTGTIDPEGTDGGPVLENFVPTNGFTWTTYAERLEAAGVSWRVYQSSTDYMEGNPLRWFARFRNLQPGDPLYDRGLALVPDVVSAFQADVASNTLPQVSWIIPGYSVSEHPPYSPSLGQEFIKQLLDAVASNPEVYNSTVFIITYDENGGFFDHVPSPTPPRGTADEFVFGWPIGPGIRVPTIIVSPWTRGGYVCSQLFDHTSTIQFLEAWTGVMEPNISAWRRQVCGDLTSAFDFSRRNPDYPALPPAIVSACGSGYNPLVPSPQVLPAQEPGNKLARPLPYQPNVTSYLDCSIGRVEVNMMNSGLASVHYAIYANDRPDGPWQYDVISTNSVSDSFDVLGSGRRRYDFSCYGPNGFQRRFAGAFGTDCNSIEVTSDLDTNADLLMLTFTNGTEETVTFTVTDGYQMDGPWTFVLSPGDLVINSFSTVATNNGWYDLSTVADIEPGFLRRFTGHIEIGAAQTGGMRPAPPMVSIELQGGMLVLSYPAWASDYSIEQTDDLFSGVWTPLNSATVLSGSTMTAVVPITSDAAYFRLRK